MEHPVEYLVAIGAPERERARAAASADSLKPRPRRRLGLKLGPLWRTGRGHA